MSCSFFFFFFKQKTAYEMRISDWSSDVCSSDLENRRPLARHIGFRLMAARALPQIVGAAIFAGQIAGGEAVIGNDPDPLCDAQFLQRAFILVAVEQVEFGLHDGEARQPPVRRDA